MWKNRDLKKKVTTLVQVQILSNLKPTRLSGPSVLCTSTWHRQSHFNSKYFINFTRINFDRKKNQDLDGPAQNPGLFLTHCRKDTIWGFNLKDLEHSCNSARLRFFVKLNQNNYKYWDNNAVYLVIVLPPPKASLLPFLGFVSECSDVDWPNALRRVLTGPHCASHIYQAISPPPHTHTHSHTTIFCTSYVSNIYTILHPCFLNLSLWFVPSYPSWIYPTHLISYILEYILISSILCLISCILYARPIFILHSVPIFSTCCYAFCLLIRASNLVPVSATGRPKMLSCIV